MFPVDPNPTSESVAQSLIATKLDGAMGLDIGHFAMAGTRFPVDDRAQYWAHRRNDRIYAMTLLFAQLFCRTKNSVADIGCHTSPLVLMLPEFKKRFAIDPSAEAATSWKDVDGAVFINDYLQNVDIPKVTGGDVKFDLIICNQVVEHVPDPKAFIDMLCSKTRRLIISTTFETPAGYIEGHIWDPISLEMFESWFPRQMLCTFITRGRVSGKIIGVI